ncbi:MAG TPA: hypothetical protein VEW11_00330 [Gaiellaceae bacterium]|nr:hypothetical protein [Gaiellaceae bacterium]
MAEIAHPYQETAADAAAPAASGRRRVSFSELVEAWAVRESGDGAEERYQKLRAAFVHHHGEITDSYICESGPMAVAVTAIAPNPLERKLLRLKDRIEMHSETETLVRMHPEVAQVLHRAEVQYVSVRNALRGLSQRLLVNWLFVWLRDLMLVSIPSPDGTVVPLTAEDIEEQGKELDRIEEHYQQAASREAQIVYLGGMLGGVLALCAITVPVGILLAASDVPVNLTTFFGCLIAGALGALVSVVTRMSADKFHVRHEVGRSYVQRVAAFRPFIGGVFGLLVYFALQGGLIRQLDVPEDSRDRFAFFLVLAFAAGFSERLVKEVLRSADGDDGAATKPAPRPDAGAPERPQPGG